MEKMEKNQNVKVHPAAIELLINLTWEYAQKILWQKYNFTEFETEVSKNHIRKYYQLIDPAQFESKALRLYSSYCERIDLASKYVNRYSHRYIPHPCIWLDPKNPKGFCGTKKWYERKLKKDQSRNQHIHLVIQIPTLITFKTA
jgi:hypothetical protein